MCLYILSLHCTLVSVLLLNLSVSSWCDSDLCACCHRAPRGETESNMFKKVPQVVLGPESPTVKYSVIYCDAEGEVVSGKQWSSCPAASCQSCFLQSLNISLHKAPERSVLVCVCVACMCMCMRALPAANKS